MWPAADLGAPLLFIKYSGISIESILSEVYSLEYKRTPTYSYKLVVFHFDDIPDDDFVPPLFRHLISSKDPWLTVVHLIVTTVTLLK